jgi:polyphenol oxidase
MATNDWVVPEWPAPSRVRSLITTRNGGVSTGAHASFNLGLRAADDPQAVAKNRAILRDELPGHPVWMRQVHGNQVIRADEATGEPEADAAYTRLSGTVCTVMIADCLPVLLCDVSATVVGVAHAGWRGLSSGVVENTLAAMRAPAGELLAFLGPAIGPAAFEVGADVRDAFLASDAAAEVAFKPKSSGKWLADLFLLTRQRLLRAGVRNIYGGGLCTFSDAARFYSYRRDQTTGRMAALIWLAETQQMS